MNFRRVLAQELGKEYLDSRERERRRRKKQAECIKRCGGFHSLSTSEGKEPVSLLWDGFQWVAKPSNKSGVMVDPILINNTRKLRRLYFGNLPLHLGLTEECLSEMIFKEMKERGMCNDPAVNPIFCIWFAKEKGNYGFVEFATIEETDKALNLDGMLCMDMILRVSRPNDYCSATMNDGGWASQSHNRLAGVIPNVGAALETAENLAKQVLKGGVCNLEETNLVVFKHIILESDGIQKDEYIEILEDVVEGVSEFGRVVKAAIITPYITKVDSSFDSGDVYLYFATPEELKNCVNHMKNRRYYDRPINHIFVSNDVWKNRIRTLPSNVILEFEVGD